MVCKRHLSNTQHRASSEKKIWIRTQTHLDQFIDKTITTILNIMNASIYLQSFGWKEGEALKKGGLKKPILVKHKKDTKGLGHDTNDSDMWWEKLFDGQLKNLEVNNNNKNGGVSFETNEEKVVDAFQKSISPLYKMFVKGEGLAGTVGKTDHTKESHREISSSKALEDMEKLTNKDTFLENIKDNASSSDEKDRNKKKKSEKKTKDGKESKKSKHGKLKVDSSSKIDKEKKKSKKKSKDGILSKEKKRLKSNKTKKDKDVTSSKDSKKKKRKSESNDETTKSKKRKI